jgi:tryptophan synthase alpha subunit
VGFGDSKASQVNDLLGFADGVIVGSYLMDEVMKASDPAAAAGRALRTLVNGEPRSGQG